LLVAHPQEVFELMVAASQGARHEWCNEIVFTRMKAREQPACLQKKGRVETQACPVAWSRTGRPFLPLLAFPNGKGEQRDHHKTQRKDKMMTQQDESTQPENAETTPTRVVSVGEVRFAYRRFGNPSATPLVFLQHFRGSMDNWDPALLNGFAKYRTVITFDNAGVGFSSGEVPDNVAAMAQYALDFLDALGLSQVDLLGFSLGGYIAQHLALHHPQLVRRLILAGTGPGKGEGTQDLNPTILDAASLPPSRNGLLQLFFEPTETSRAAGAAFWDRLQRRAGERDPSLTGPGVQAQRTALTRWDRTEDAAYPHVRAIAHPVLVAGGSHDLIIPTVNAFVLAQRLPNAQLILYPDSGHGFLFQYHTLFGQHATLFLES
jgi:pimeloyl-ACP methyl ester carboxylesterase